MWFLDFLQETRTYYSDESKCPFYSNLGMGSRRESENSHMNFPFFSNLRKLFNIENPHIFSKTFLTILDILFIYIYIYEKFYILY